MNLFLSRIGKSLLNILLVVITLVVVALLIVVVGGVIFWLPFYFFNNTYPVLYIFYVVFLFIGVILLGEWDKIKFWFYWQFVEPFKKSKEED